MRFVLYCHHIRCKFLLEGNLLGACFRLLFLISPLLYYSIFLAVQQTCPAGRTPCFQTGSCIPVEWLCDGEPDCDGGEDEYDCGKLLSMHHANTPMSFRSL